MLRLTIDSTGVFYSLERVDLVRSDLASLRDLHAVDGGRVAEAVLQLHPILYNARTEQVWILKLGVLS